MESLSDTNWDVVISGTGLQQSLLALALSRSDLNVLHVDANGYYGGNEAALSLQDAAEWTEKHAAPGRDDGDAIQDPMFSSAHLVGEHEGLSARAYNLALAPQIIHAKSELITQLLSSKAFRQIEFLAVGSFFIFQPASGASAKPSLSRIPSTREDVFSTTAISARAKRGLMKFIKFALEYNTDENTQVWKPHADGLLVDFLASDFKLDANLQSYVTTLTLSLDGKVSVQSGLEAINRHMTSMGAFGAGFAAVYPKWGGLSEIAQVGCRAGAVGGAVYILGTDVQSVSPRVAQGEDAQGNVEVHLGNGVTVTTKTLVKGQERAAPESPRLSRLTAIVSSRLSHLFENVVEGSPQPAVALVAFPAGSVSIDEEQIDYYPVYAMVHSSTTGECGDGQTVVYLSTIATPHARRILDEALAKLLACSVEAPPPSQLFGLYYEQRQSLSSVTSHGNVVTVPSSNLSLAFDDSALSAVREAWHVVKKSDEADASFMQFEDREGQDDEDVYD